MPSDSRGDTSLFLQAAIDGDRDSLSWLVAHHSPLLLAQARWRLGANHARTCDPEDLVQEAWLVALPRLRELRPRDGRATPVLLRFLATTILNRVNNLARDALRRGTPGATDPAAIDPSDERTGVVTAAVRAEQRQHTLGQGDEKGEDEREVPEFGRHLACAFWAWSTACLASGGM